MKIERVKTGYLEENCYILTIGNSCLVIDPGEDFFKIKEKIKDKKVEAVLITHHHFDHVGALSYFDKSLVYSFFNLEEKAYTFGPFSFEVFFNPGHSEDSISFYFKEEKVMFVGDFIFNGSIGRCDLEGGDFAVMLKSIQKIKQIKENIVLYPGHGEKTTLDNEKRKNMYFSY